MYTVTAEKSNNLLKINFSGQVYTTEAREALVPIKNSIMELSPGFRLLSDLTQLVSMEAGCASFIRQAMDWCNERGISLVVRIIPDPRKDIGFSILSIFHYRRGVRIVTVETLEEAIKALGIPG